MRRSRPNETLKRTVQNGLLVFVLSFLLCLFSGCAAGLFGGTAGQTETERTVYAMDTYLTVRAYGDASDNTSEAILDRVLDDALKEVEALEKKLSVTIETSEIAKANATGSAALSTVTAELLTRALELCEETDGALDITVYPLVRAWGFTTGETRVPGEEEIRELLPYVDYRRVALGYSVTLEDGMAIDLGSVAKGFACDKMARRLKDVTGSALIDFGGNICAIGAKPDGSDWRIGVRSPEGNDLLGVLSVRDRFVVTSGGYERCFTDADGNLRWHIIDPKTGYPARNGLLSVTVVGTKGIRCDALSTALFVMGTEKAIGFWREKGDFGMILVTDDGRLLVTPDLAKTFTADKNAPYAQETIREAE